MALYFIHVINWFQDQSCPNAYFHNDGFELLPNDAEPFSITSDLLLKAIDRLTLSKLGFDFEANTSILKLLSFFIGQTIHVYYGTNSVSGELDSLKHSEYKLTELI